MTRKNNCFYTCLFAVLLLCHVSCKENKETYKPDAPEVPASERSQVAFWLTNPDKSVLFAEQKESLNFTAVSNQNQTIEIDTTQLFQTIDGFGYTLTGGSAYVMNRMNAVERAALLKELFATDGKNIGVSYLRISIGASDLNGQVFTYNDLSSGETDPEMLRFSLSRDKADLIPVLNEILAINPAIKILGSPWTAPEWMKTNKSFIGGSLKPEYYDAYARYFVKYIQAMQAEGIRIDAITLQNEPLNPSNNPSMLMSAAEQAQFIKQRIGPAFQVANLSTKIILYDHNTDRIDYPISILNDPEARKYVDGSAFHLYAGGIHALSEVHTAHPDKNIYFTEQWIGAPGNFSSDLAWHVKNLLVGATRNWSRTVLEWNLAANPELGPHTDGGCTSCLPAVTVSREGQVTRNTAYYVVAHASKFVRPGSVRVATNVPGALQNVAFQTPDGQKVLLVLNDSGTTQTFNIRFRGKVAVSSLKPGAVGTYVW
ncbi:glycoside hydrolase family 30 protein [Pontibacter liquoris]|uniref:glycoside hydrolase family 30 protein n=1 Tax=Pontibacter liquoris TaxID=2905677 RepID=UPI001FA7539C|nr:glycoside hydrolase family 30 beta sandwich domain-containing protein [Pontibacter liquoris]